MAARGPVRSQEELFGGAPRPLPAQELRIAPQGAAPLGKEQQTFNRLVRKVEILRQKLAEWAAFEPLHQERVARELMPLLRQFGAARRETILILARILAGKGTGGMPGRVEQRNLRQHLLDLAQVQLSGDPEDDEILAIHDQYADLGFADDRALSREMAAQFFGVELDDHELGGSVEDVMAAAAAKAAEAVEEQARAAREQRAADAKAGTRRAQKAAAAEQAAQEASQSVREVFRKLASALHPDRASDEDDRTRRHALMQRANHAYGEGDLLGLLALQLEIEQIDAAHLGRVTAARLVHYNRVLRAQVRELEQELAGITGHFAGLSGEPPSNVTPAVVEHTLKRDLAELKQDIKGMKAHQALMQDPAARKRWLQQYARQRREDERMDALRFEALESGFDAFGIDADVDPFAAPPRRQSASRPKRGKRRR